MNNTPFARGLSLAASVHLFLLLPCICQGAPHASPTPTYILPPPTKTATSAPSPILVPTGTNFGFENSSGWTTSGSATIITLSGTQVHEGTHVASLSGSNAIISGTTTPLTSATWRLRFSAAQKTASDTQTLRVTVGGTNVVALGEPKDTTFEEVTTRPFTASGPTEIRFEGVTAGETALIDDVRAEQVSLWTNGSTWQEGVVPSGTDNVRIPSTARVALSGSCAAATVNVNGALLVSNTNSSLNARWVVVSGSDSVFEVGTEGCPFLQNFTLTLTGTLGATENIMGAGTKFLMAMGGGLIDLHGKPQPFFTDGTPERSWVRLSGDVASGMNVIRTNYHPDWAGLPNPTTIVIAPSTLPVRTRVIGTGTMSVANSADAIEAEVRTISSNDGVGTLTLASALLSSGTMTPAPLQYKHLGSVYSSTRPSTYIAASGTTLNVRTWYADERAEVGLLTHNVVVQGDSYSETLQFGGHVMIMKMSGTSCACATNGGGIGRFSNVEFYRMGQKQMIGRYPIHWHMLGDEGDGQYAKSCSIWHSYNRAITLHGTGKVELTGNVAYDHIGHGIFLEDGSETNNIIQFNLVLGTIRPPLGQELLPTDNAVDTIKRASPASYWITNPNNTMDHNVAAGCIGNGFWFIFPTSPLGLSSTDTRFQSMKPNQEPLGSFASNSAHSNTVAFSVNDSINMDNTLKTNVGWNPTLSGTDSYVSLTNFTCYENVTGIYAGIAGFMSTGAEKVHYGNATLADNQYAIFLASYQTVENSLVWAETPGKMLKLPSFISPDDTSKNIYAYRTYDGPGRLVNCHLVGFTGGTNSNNHVTWLIGNVAAAFKHANHTMQGLTFDSGTAPIQLIDVSTSVDMHLWPATIRDMDGTLTGTAGSTIVSNHPMMLPSGTNTPKPPGSTNAYMTPLTFGLISVISGTGGNQVTSANRPEVRITRQNVTLNSGTLQLVSGTDAQQYFDMARDNSWYTGAGATLKPEFPNVIEHYVQGIVNANSDYTSTNGFYVYEFRYDSGTAAPWPTGVKDLTLKLDDLLLPGESALICFKRLGTYAVGNLTVETKDNIPAPFAKKDTLALLISGTEPSYYYNPALEKDLYVKIVGVSRRNGTYSGGAHITWSGTFVPLPPPTP